MKNLVLKNVTKAFGGVAAVSDATMEVEEGSIHGLIGPNGAGKTTLFNLITGMLNPNSGLIQFNGRNLARLKPNQRTALGICRTYQNIKLFKSATVLDNVMVAMPYRMKSALIQLVIKTPFREIKEEKEVKERAGRLLSFVGLYDKRNYVASALPFGDQRRLEIARALATKPSLLLLDEPCAGMNQAEKEPMIRLIKDIREQEITVIVIEHDISMIAEICDTVTVLNFGIVIAQDCPDSIQKNPLVIEAYLGREELAYG
jgi:branched-chain amino acid transport system ATP-binding protein